MAEGAEEGLFVEGVLMLLIPQTMPGHLEEKSIVLHEDNEGAQALAGTPEFRKRKRLDVTYICTPVCTYTPQIDMLLPELGEVPARALAPLLYSYKTTPCSSTRLDTV